MLPNNSEKCNQKRNSSFAEMEEGTGTEMTSSLKKIFALDWTGLDKRGLAKHRLLKRKQQKPDLLEVDL